MASVAGRQDLESSVCKEPPFTDLTALPWEGKDTRTGSAAVFSASYGLFGQGREEKLSLGTGIPGFWRNQHAIHSPCIVVIRVEQAPGHSGGKTQGVNSLAASSGDAPVPQPVRRLCQIWAWERGGLPPCFLGWENTRTSGLKERKAVSKLGWTLLCCSHPQIQAPTFPWLSLWAPSCSQHPPSSSLSVLTKITSQEPKGKKEKTSHDSHVDYISVYICQNASNYILKICAFFACKLTFFFRGGCEKEIREVLCLRDGG